MIILDDKKLIEAKFRNEQELEDVVVANSEHFFGPTSVFIPKAKIKTADGTGTIPDGFAIDLASRSWYVVEAELGHHSIWTHIAPQVTKQLLAISRSETRQLLEEILSNGAGNLSRRRARKQLRDDVRVEQTDRYDLAPPVDNQRERRHPLYPILSVVVFQGSESALDQMAQDGRIDAKIEPRGAHLVGRGLHG